jgi:hypothetical protein
MKIFIYICAVLLTSLSAFAQTDFIPTETSIYNLSFQAIDSTTIYLQQYADAGKKFCFIIAPLSDDSTFEQLKTLDTADVIIIGIVSTVSFNPDSLQQLYAGTGIILTALPDEQAPLLRWLTDYKQNGHFNEPLSGAGQSFWVSETGRLYAVLSKDTPLNAPVVQVVQNTEIPTDASSIPPQNN